MQQSIFFGSMLCFVIVLRNFAGRNISQKTWFDAIVFVAGGILLYYAWCNIAEIYFSVNLLNHIYVPFVYFMGPATYVGFFLTVDVEFQFTRGKLLYFAPGGGVDRGGRGGHDGLRNLGFQSICNLRRAEGVLYCPRGQVA